MESETTALAIVKETIPALNLENANPEVVEAVASLIKQMTTAPEGIEAADYRWRADRIKIMTGTTQDETAPGSATKGDVWSNGELLWRVADGPSRPFLFIPVFYWKSRARFPHNEMKPDCASLDCKTNLAGDKQCDSCPDLPFRNGAPTACHDSHNFIVVAHDLSGIYEVSFSKTSAPAGAGILKLARSKKALWDLTLGLTTNMKDNGKNKWHVYNVASFSDTPRPDGIGDVCRFVKVQAETARHRALEALEQRRSEVEAALNSGGAVASTGAYGDEDLM